MRCGAARGGRFVGYGFATIPDFIHSVTAPGPVGRETPSCMIVSSRGKRVLVGFLFPALWAGLLHLGSSINITVRMVLHQVTGKLEHGFKALVTVTASKFLGLGVGHIGAYIEARLFLVGVKADARFAPARGL